MQIIHFIFKSIANQFKTEKLLQALIALGMVISNVLFLIFGGFYFQESQSIKEKEFQTNRVTFSFSNHSELEAVYQRLIEEDQISQVLLNCKRQGDMGLINIHASAPQRSYEAARVKLGEIKGNGTGGWFCGSESFNSNLRSQELELQINTPLELEEKELLCSGIIMTDEFDILISTVDFFNINEALAFDITYVFKGNTGTTQIEQINSEIIDNHNPASVIRPRETARFSLGGLLQMLGVNVLLIFISIVNYFFLYTFSLKKRFYMYSVMKLCGMTKSKLFLFLLLEMCLWFTFSFVLSIPVYSLVFPVVLRGGIAMEALAVQFIYSFLILFLMNFFIFVVASINTIKKSAVALYQESVVEK